MHDVTLSKIDKAITFLKWDNAVLIDATELENLKLQSRRLLAFAVALSDIENDPKGEKLIEEMQKLDNPPTVEQFLNAIDKHLLT